MTSKQFTDGILEALRDAGWTTRGKSAWLVCSGAVINVDMQKSKYDDTVFVNVGLALHELGHDDYPKYTDCHLQFRVERLLQGFPDADTDVEMLHDEVRRREPDLRKLGEIAELRALSSRGYLSGGLIRKEARACLTKCQGAGAENGACRSNN